MRPPDTFAGVIVGNEVLDAMPVKLLARHGGAQDGVWHERGVAVQEGVLPGPTGRRRCAPD